MLVNQIVSFLVFGGITFCGPVKCRRCFGGLCCTHLQGLTVQKGSWNFSSCRWSQHASTKYQCLDIQKLLIFIIIIISFRPSDLA